MPAKKALKPAKKAAKPVKKSAKLAKKTIKPAKKALRPAKKAIKPGGCTPFFIEIAVVPSVNREIRFSLEKECLPIRWIIHFELKEKIGNEMRIRVSVTVRVGPTKEASAEKIAEAKKANPDVPVLTPAKAALLEGRVADRARELPAGTTDDPELNSLLMRVL